jgi:hypothetical protein
MALLQKNGNLHLFWWFCCKESDGRNVFAFFYGDGVLKKVMAASDFLFIFGHYGLVHYN